MKWLRYIGIVLGAAFLFAGCDVHELPHGSADVAVTIRFSYEMPIEQWKTVTLTTRNGMAQERDYEIRHIVRLYPYTGESYSRTPAYSFIYNEEYSDNPDHEITLSVAPANYRVVAWTDYVEKGSGNELFYSADDFAEVTLTSLYEGAQQYRDAFRGSKDLRLAKYNYNGASTSTEIEMSRPLARYNFIATDKNQFITYWKQQLALRKLPPVRSNDAPDIDLNKFKVRFMYPQYLPSANNLFTDRPVDSKLGISFDTVMSLRDDGDVDLGFDYVFVNGKESKVIVSLSIYDENWEYISTVHNVEVPLLRGHQTTIKGKFLTNGISSGVTINPEYEDEYNIYL